MEQYQIALAPEIGLSATDFASAWNKRDDARDLGEVASSPAMPAAYLDPDTTLLLLNVALSISTGILSAVIYDLLKDAFGLNKESFIVEIRQQEGNKLIIVKPRDE